MRQQLTTHGGETASRVNDFLTIIARRMESSLNNKFESYEKKLLDIELAVNKSALNIKVLEDGQMALNASQREHSVSYTAICYVVNRL